MGWLERAVDVLAAEGLKVILCTPTAAPPPWLFVRHPGMVPQDRQGANWFRGSRRHACLNNRPYRRYCRHIVREMAKVFGRRTQVCAWQIDNELGSHGSGRCYCDDCEQAFREWLKGRYGTVDRLNKLWGTVFWSQEFKDWHEIPAPRRTPAGVHPSLALDYSRFTSATCREFINEQRKVIRQYAGQDVLVTTNCLGLLTPQVDQFSLGRAQDIASVDNYPCGSHNLDEVALKLDLTRSIKREPFWVLEQQAGMTMIRGPHGRPRPGQLRLWAYQAAARGAELISFFRWRTCAFAQEMHWYGMLDANGARPRRFGELKEAIAELKGRAPLWEGRLPRAQVALVLDYHAHWALQADAMVAGTDYLAQFRALYTVLRQMGVSVDIVPPEQDPTGYAVLVAPMPVIHRERVTERWQAFVDSGGVLLATAPAGYRTEQNTWTVAQPPESLAELLGIRVAEYDVAGEQMSIQIAFGDAEFAAAGLCSVLELHDAEAQATYLGDCFAGGAAVTRRRQGEGAAWFLGAVATDGLYEHLLKTVLAAAGVAPSPWSSDLIEVIPLAAGQDEPPLTFVLNHSDETVELELGQSAVHRDLLSDREHTGKVVLEPYGVALLQG